MPGLLNEDIRKQVHEVFGQLQNPVQILFFGQKGDCNYCDDTRQLLDEVTSLSDKLGLSVYDMGDNKDIADQYQIDKAPSLVIAAKNGDQVVDYGIHFAGIPSGHEFSTLIHDLILVSSRESGLDENTRDFLKTLADPVHLQVFVTPTWPYCPRAVVLAHQMAMESPFIVAEAVEAMEFPDLADRFDVSGVPQTTINQGAGTIVGAVPPDYLIHEIQRILTPHPNTKNLSEN